MTSPRTLPRPARRDAARNQQLVTDAARFVLAEHGLDASMELIAARAGVGIGTVYRNFPTKDALIDELIRDIFDDLIAAATAARAEVDGLEQFLRHLGSSFVEHRGYSDLLVGRSRAECAAQELREEIARLTAEAKRCGRLAAWVSFGDVMATVWAMRGVIVTGGAAAGDTWRRFLDIQLAALRVTAPATTQPPLSAIQLTRITARQQ